jgi:hypothetical protein
VAGPPTWFRFGDWELMSVMSFQPSAGSTVMRRWTMASASPRLSNVQVLMGLSPSPWRARTRQVVSRSSQTSRRASRPNRPFHHRCTSSTRPSIRTRVRTCQVCVPEGGRSASASTMLPISVGTGLGVWCA